MTKEDIIQSQLKIQHDYGVKVDLELLTALQVIIDTINTNQKNNKGEVYQMYNADAAKAFAKEKYGWWRWLAFAVVILSSCIGGTFVYNNYLEKTDLRTRIEVNDLYKRREIWSAQFYHYMNDGNTKKKVEKYVEDNPYPNK